MEMFLLGDQLGAVGEWNVNEYEMEVVVKTIFCIPAILRVGSNFQMLCKMYFLENLPYSHGRLFRVIDSRGKKSPINRFDYSDIVAYIKYFPVYYSHYSRKRNPDRKYLLHPDLNI